MKKLIIFVLILAMMPVIALADLPDISGLTNDELIELNHQIQLRLFSDQLANGVLINPGQYVVGQDLPAGSYRSEVVLPDDAYTLGLACVYNPDDLFVETSGSVTGKGYENIGKIIMEDGQIFVVDTYPVRLYPYTGLFN